MRRDTANKQKQTLEIYPKMIKGLKLKNKLEAKPTKSSE